MAKRMLIDASHTEETRVVVIGGNRLEEFDYETANKKQLKGNIYLAKVTRVEPSLQAAFIDYGGNRHGFLAFSEVHPDYYRIPISDREELLRAEQAAAQTFDDDIVDGDDGDERGDDSDAAQGEIDGDAGADASADASGDEDRDDDGEAAQPGNGAPAPNGEDADGLHAADDAPADDVPADDVPADDVPADDVPADDASADSATDNSLDEDGDDEREDDLDGDGDDADESNRPRGRRGRGGRGRSTSDSRRRGGNRSVETLGSDDVDDVDRQRRMSYRRYRIQEVVSRRQILLVQVVKEERGNKGAALTTYISLAGRYCVLMPNTPRGGGISRKITNVNDRRKLKSILDDLNIPDGMAVIVRTAGAQRTKAEIRRDYEYLIKLWDEIRERTLQSTAPALIHEEANLTKRSIRDLYAKDIDEVLVEGDEGYRIAKDFMKMLMPSHAKRVKPYKEADIPLFQRYQVEAQLDNIHSPVVQLKSGGYIVLNATEALVAIDVNSGRATRERNIEETAFRTNLEAADEIARQLRLRDLAGLIVIDFIDMEDYRNRHNIERRLKEAMRHDRARIQIGRISAFGLLEMSRQRLRPSVIEASSSTCPTCGGTGVIRSTESTALTVLRAIEEEGTRHRAKEITVYVPTNVALYLLNHKRAALADIEARYEFHVLIANDEQLVPPDHRIERTVTSGETTADDEQRSADDADGETKGRRRGRRGGRRRRGDDDGGRDRTREARGDDADASDADADAEEHAGSEAARDDDKPDRKPRRSRGRGRSKQEDDSDDAEESSDGGETGDDEKKAGDAKSRRRGRRGGRRRGRRDRDGEEAGAKAGSGAEADTDADADADTHADESADVHAPDTSIAEPADTAGGAKAQDEMDASDDKPKKPAAKRAAPRRRRQTADAKKGDDKNAADGSNGPPKKQGAEAEAGADAAGGNGSKRPGKPNGESQPEPEPATASEPGAQPASSGDTGDEDKGKKRTGWWSFNR